jgi:2-polyprenyl-3-methyl-5-hydroxy-6-metoxy-1,4-benzoquinol methylase
MKKQFQYKGEIESIEICALCNSSSSEIDEIFSKNLGLIDPFKCKKCKKCGLRWLSPRPTQEGYKSIYTMDNYYEGDCAVEKYSSVVQLRKNVFRKRIAEISHYFDKKNQIKTILDIGAATGDFVYEAKRVGFESVGIELSADARQQAMKKYSIRLYDYTLEDLFQKGYRFDIIHMNHVFEHILNPNMLLKECNKLLTKNGLLVIEVPQQLCNDLDRLKKILRITKEIAFTPYSLHHTYFYTPKTISSLLKRHNYSIKRIRTANLENTPLVPFNIVNITLAIYLALSDKIHRGGNMIEVFAQKYE